MEDLDHEIGVDSPSGLSTILSQLLLTLIKAQGVADLYLTLLTYFLSAKVSRQTPYRWHSGDDDRRIERRDVLPITLVFRPF